MRMVAGPRAVLETLRGHGPRVSVIYVAKERRRALSDLERHAQRHGVPIEERRSSELDALSTGFRHQGVIAVTSDYTYTELDAILDSSNTPTIVALDEVTDPHNLGAIVRSSVAFGADGMLIPKHRSSHITPTVARASAGATEHAKIAVATNLARTLRELQDAGLRIVGLSGDGETDLCEVDWGDQGCVLVLGSEGKGLRRLVREACDCMTRIELPGPISSLNVSVAAGIALFEAARSRRDPR